MVADDSEWDRGANGPRAEVVQRIDDGKKFLVINFVVDFCGCKFAGEECDRVQKTLLIRLVQDSGKREF